MDTSILIGHIKAQEEKNREADRNLNGRPPYRPIGQEYPVVEEGIADENAVVIDGVANDKVERVQGICKIEIPFDVASRGTADLYVYGSRVSDDFENAGAVRIELDAGALYSLDVTVPAKDVAALGLDVKEDLGLRANGMDTRLRVTMPASEIKLHANR